MGTLILIDADDPAELTYLGVGPASSSGTSATQDFAGVDFGDDEPGRVVAIPVFWSSGGGNTLITSATIGGISAQVDVQQSVAVPSARIFAGVISAMVPSGTSGPVQINFAGAVANNFEIHSYNIVGLVEYPTITASDNAQASGSTDTSLFVQTKAGGGAITAAFARNAANQFTITGATEDYDHAIFENFFRIAGGSYESTSDEAAHEIRWQNAINNGAVVAVSYR